MNDGWILAIKVPLLHLYGPKESQGPENGKKGLANIHPIGQKKLCQ